MAKYFSLPGNDLQHHLPINRFDLFRFMSIFWICKQL